MSLFDDVAYTAEREYHEILQRADNPHPSDVARIRELVGTLGITMTTAKRDLETIKRSRELDKILATMPERTQATHDANVSHLALQNEHDEYLDRVRPILADLQFKRAQTQRELEAVYEARGELQRLRDAHPRAFGLKREDASK